MKKLSFIIVLLIFSGFIHSQSLTGIKTIKKTGGNYSSFASAINDLNAKGAGTGGVIFNVDAGFVDTAANLSITTIRTSATSQVVFQKSGSGRNPLIIAAKGIGNMDGMIKLVGADYITFDRIDLMDNSSNINDTQRMEWGYALLRASCYNGCQHNTIKNCMINLSKSNNGCTGIYSNCHLVNDLTFIGVMDSSGANSYNNIYNDTISNTQIGIYFKGTNGSNQDYYDSHNNIGVDGGNVIVRIGGSSSTMYGIYSNYQSLIKIANNTIAGGTGSTGDVFGIYHFPPNRTVIEIYNNSIQLTSSSVKGLMYGIITTNNFSSDYTASSMKVYNNTITNCDYSATDTGTFTGIYLSTASSVMKIYNNLICNNILGGKGNFIGLTCNGGITKNIYSNKVYNNKKTGSKGNLYCFSPNSNTSTFYNNLAYNDTITGSGSLFGYYNSSLPTFESVYNCTFHHLVSTGSGSVYGIFSTSAAIKRIYSDSVYGLRSNGGSIYGIYNSAGTDSRYFNNTIFDLNAGGSTGTCYGMSTTGTTNTYFYNNVISGLNASSSTNLIAVAAFNITGSAYAYLFYNSVYINAASTSTSTFGTSALYAVTTATIDLRNNIFVNHSIPGTSGGKTSVIQRNAWSTAGYSVLSNNNCYYSGTQGVNNVIYYDGTFADSLTPFKTRFSPRESYTITENPPFVNLLKSPCDLHLKTTIPTGCESEGISITVPISIQDDRDGNLRNSVTPDIGAYEGSYILNDVNPPVITLPPLQNVSTSTRNVVATIFDPSGVPTTGTAMPVLYFKVNRTGTYNPVFSTYLGSNQYGFPLSATAVTGDSIFLYIVASDASSMNNTGAYPSAGASGFTTNPPGCGNPPVNPITYKIIASFTGGNYFIGGTGTPAPGCQYVSLTKAFQDMSGKELTGAVNLILTSSYLSSQEGSFPVTLQNIIGSSAATMITIKPDAGVNATIITGSSASVIKIYNTNYVTIDGSNNNSQTRNLTIANTLSTASSQVAVWISGSGSTAGCSNIIVKNCNISMASSTATNFGIYIAGTTVSTTGTGDNNNNITIENNLVTKVLTGIYVGGTSSSPATKIQIKGNTLGSYIYGSGIGTTGIIMNNINSSSVFSNDVFGIYAASTTNRTDGMEFSEAYNTDVYNNRIHDITDTFANANITTGIYVSNGYKYGLNSNLNFYNNSIYAVISNGNQGIPYGNNGFVFMQGAGFRVIHNSICLTGNRDTLSNHPTHSPSADIYISNNSTNFDIRNNVLFNNQNANTLMQNSYCIYNENYETAFTNLNNNDYYFNTLHGYIAYQRKEIRTFSEWKSITGKDDQSITLYPVINSCNDPRPMPGSPLLSAGTPTFVNTDIIGDARNASSPTIGAWENAKDETGPVISCIPFAFSSVTAGKTLLVSIKDSSGVPASGSGRPVIYWKNKFKGTYNFIGGVYVGGDTFSFFIGSGASIGDTIYYYIVAQDKQSTPNTSCYPSYGATGFTVNPPAVSIPPINPAFYKLIGSIAGGKYYIGGTGSTLGPGCTYKNVTNAVGDINSKEILGPITLILSSYYVTSEESGQITIGPITGSSAVNTITLKPDIGTNQTISGKVYTNNGLFIFSHASNFIIDGSNNGTTSRNLVIQNIFGNATTATIQILSLGMNKDCRNIVIKNCTIKAKDVSSDNTWGVFIGGAMGYAGYGNRNITIQNNLFQNTMVGIQAYGNNDSCKNLSIIQNSFENITAQNMYYQAIQLTHTMNSEVIKNTIRNISCYNGSFWGISLGYCRNIRVSQNNITGYKLNGSYVSSYSGTGISVWGFQNDTNVLIDNNLISDLSGTDGVTGMDVYNNIHGVKIYNNSIHLTGYLTLKTGTAVPSACLKIGGNADYFDIRNNTFTNAMSDTFVAQKSYAVYCTAPDLHFNGINNNNYYPSGKQAVFGFMNRDIDSLSSWKSASLQDSNSISIDPLFVSNTNLVPTSGYLNRTGKYISCVPYDFDSNLRSKSTPDIGAYEFVPKPVVKTGTSFNISVTMATIAGKVNANNEDSVKIYFDYGTSYSYGTRLQATPNKTKGLKWDSAYVNLTGLTYNTYYHYRIVAVNGAVTSYGDDKTFTTKLLPLTAQTDSSNMISSTGATLYGSVYPGNLSTTVTFDYGFTSLYGTSIPAAQSPVSGTTFKQVTLALTGLTPNTTYHYRVTATNGYGTEHGVDKIFRTLKKSPLVITDKATLVGLNSAQMNGTVHPYNDTFAVIFEYGPNLAYGNKKAAVQSPVNGSTPVLVWWDLTGLSLNSTTHYRVIAVSGQDTFYGRDTFFVTGTLSPTAITEKASPVGLHMATLNGTVNAHNCTATVTFQYGLSASYSDSIVGYPSPLNDNMDWPVSATIKGLSPFTLYHYRVVVTNCKGTSYGKDSIFTTQDTLSQLTTSTVILITQSSARSGGSITDSGGAKITSRGICWSTSLKPTIALSTRTTDGNGAGTFTSNMFGLIPDTTYYVRAYATNHSGTSYGNELSFRTLPHKTDTLATLVTNSATSITKTSAQTGGYISDSGGHPINVRGVCWSLSPGPTIALTTKTSDGTGAGGFISNLTGLTPNTTYYIRAYATNSFGTAYGNELNFKTLQIGIDGIVSIQNVIIYSYQKNLIIKYDNALSKGEVSISDLIGHILIRKEISGNETHFNLSGYSSGYYLVCFKTSNFIKTTKIFNE